MVGKELNEPKQGGEGLVVGWGRDGPEGVH